MSDFLISQLYIENVAVIKKACIEFAPGLNILTGETGAGKSIIIDSISSIIGKRTSKDIIRSNNNKACVIAKFDNLSTVLIDYLKENNFIENKDDGLLLEREILLSGRTNCKINLKPVTVAILKNIGRDLITIHGQNDSYDLLSKDLHIDYIDSLANNYELLDEYKKNFKGLVEIKKKIQSLSINEEEKLRTIDLLKYQIKELEDADLKEDEINDLIEKKKIYSNSERINSSLNNAKTILSDNNGCLQSLQVAINSISNISDCYTEVDGLLERLNSMYYELDDCVNEISNLLSQTEYDPADLENIDFRLDLLYKLSRKYGSTTDDMIEFLNKCKQKLNEITFSEQDLKILKEEYSEKLNIVKSLASKLSLSRKKASNQFCKMIKKELEFLDMPNVKFIVSHEHTNLTISGYDDIQFLISVNPGEQPKPLSKIASGGELSRIMLAIKTVLADKDNFPTLIFDEIDTGISGSAAKKVGKKLKEISKHHQVICITHSAQIAAFADEHFLIKKCVKDNNSFTTIKKLDFNDRINEIARIISGSEPSENIINTAIEMIKNSEL